ncbi:MULTISPECIES: hypothetical protein [unclassified Pseudomonas]|uniref:hypothetical protein n=1 Tax=unclassified Pseudomonas TaxID=196821 RepID=UPI000CD08270|nr:MULTISPECIES: hypothetical protein [unclassified Pseudomonas]POA52089.1 hypothetical protein C1889_24135 [Pseudomonas sp. FW507-12TSA]
MPTETQLEQRVAALQSDLNQKDEQIDALEFKDKDRELSRRDWFDEAQRLENENSAIRLQAGGMQIEIDELRTKLADRDALLREWLEISKRHQQPVTLDTRTEAALSASAEPSAPKCKHSIKCARFNSGEIVDHVCQDCLQVFKPSAQVERDEQADFEAYALAKGWLPHMLKRRPDGNYEGWGINQELGAWMARAALERKP